jgi:hypothetical protein
MLGDSGLGVRLVEPRRGAPVGGKLLRRKTVMAATSTGGVGATGRFQKWVSCARIVLEIESMYGAVRM